MPVPVRAPLPSLVCLLLLAGCGKACNQQPDDLADSSAPIDAEFGVARNLAILVVDGARMEETFADESDVGGGWSDAADDYTDGILPNIRGTVLPTGTLIRNGYVTGITLTTPAHGDLLTGRREAFLPLAHSEGIGHYQLHYPTLFETLRSTEGGDEESTWIVANTAHLEPLEYSHYPGLGVDYTATSELLFAAGDGVGFESDDGQCVAIARQHLEEGSRMVLANLHQIDRAGHNTPDVYAATVAAADEPIVAFHEWLGGDSGIGDETLMLLLADHGRHRVGDDQQYPWTHHGCHCAGCREVPMFLSGPGVMPNVTLLEPVVMEDLTSTAAWLLGLSMPYSTGLVLTDALVGQPDVEQRRGLVRVVTSGDLVATQQWEDDRSHRSSLWVDGQELGSPLALHVEDPQVASGDAIDHVCWRELTVSETTDHWPWLIECHHREHGADWVDTQFPDDIQWPHVAPTMLSLGSGALVMAYENSLDLNTAGSVNAESMALELARWTPSAGWEQPGSPANELFYPSDPDLVGGDEAIWLALTAGRDAPTARYTRQVRVFELAWPSNEDPSWELRYSVPANDVTGRSFERQEHPALVMVGDALRLAWHAYDDDGVHLLVAQANHPDDPGSWGLPRTLDDSGQLFGHVSPVWNEDGDLFWARHGEQLDVEVCRMTQMSWIEECQDLGVDLIDSLAVDPGGAIVSISDGDGSWELVELGW